MNDDLRSDLEKYTDQWEKALKDGVFADAPKEQRPGQGTMKPNWFGHSSVEDSEIEQEEAEDWENLYKMADPDFKGGGEELIQEETEASTDKLKKVATRMANSHNPVNSDSLGHDQDVVVTQNWGFGGKEIEELAEMKIKLEQLESKLNAEEGLGGKKAKSISEQIKSLRQQIDGLSDSLNGSRLGDSESRLA